MVDLQPVDVLGADQVEIPIEHRYARQVWSQMTRAPVSRVEPAPGHDLRAALPDDRAVGKLLEFAELDGRLRAEQVAPEGFRRLATGWERCLI